MRSPQPDPACHRFGLTSGLANLALGNKPGIEWSPECSGGQVSGLGWGDSAPGPCTYPPNRAFLRSRRIAGPLLSLFRGWVTASLAWRCYGNDIAGSPLSVGLVE